MPTTSWPWASPSVSLPKSRINKQLSSHVCVSLVEMWMERCAIPSARGSVSGVGGCPPPARVDFHGGFSSAVLLREDLASAGRLADRRALRRNDQRRKAGPGRSNGQQAARVGGRPRYRGRPYQATQELRCCGAHACARARFGAVRGDEAPLVVRVDVNRRFDRAQ